LAARRFALTILIQDGICVLRRQLGRALPQVENGRVLAVLLLAGFTALASGY